MASMAAVRTAVKLVERIAMGKEEGRAGSTGGGKEGRKGEMKEGRREGREGGRRGGGKEGRKEGGLEASKQLSSTRNIEKGGRLIQIQIQIECLEPSRIPGVLRYRTLIFPHCHVRRCLRVVAGRASSQSTAGRKTAGGCRGAGCMADATPRYPSVGCCSAREGKHALGTAECVLCCRWP